MPTVRWGGYPRRSAPGTARISDVTDFLDANLLSRVRNAVLTQDVGDPGCEHDVEVRDAAL